MIFIARRSHSGKPFSRKKNFGGSYLPRSKVVNGKERHYKKEQCPSRRLASVHINDDKKERELAHPPSFPERLFRNFKNLPFFRDLKETAACAKGDEEEEEDVFETGPICMGRRMILLAS